MTAQTGLNEVALQEMRQRLLADRIVLRQRLETIHAHARTPLDRDSEEQATELANLDVVSALENEATIEVAAIDAALARLAAGTYGICTGCGESISAARLAARPASAECLACAA